MWMAQATSGMCTANEMLPESAAIATTRPASIGELPAPESIAGQGMASPVGSAPESTAELGASTAAAGQAAEATDLFADRAKFVGAIGQVEFVVLVVVFRTSAMVGSTATTRQVGAQWRG